MSDASYPRDDAITPLSNAPAGLGQRLREARERIGYSREAVATELRLHLRMITALEEDNHGSLPPPTFVAGYIRAYAKLLDLPAEELVALYLPEQQIAPPAVQIGNVRQQRRREQRRHLPLRAISYLLIGGGVLAILGWSLLRVDLTQLLAFVRGDQSAAVTPLPQPSGGERSLPLSLPSAPDAESEPLALPLPAARTPVANPIVPPAAEPPATEPPVVESVAAEPSAAEPAAVAAAALPPAVVEPPTVETAALDRPRTTPIATVALPTLSLSFERDCWTEVKDAAGNRLIYDLVKAGRSRQVEGQAPFKVFLGYAPGAEVLYNGESFDIEPFIERHIARFSVGQATDNPPPQ